METLTAEIIAQILREYQIHHFEQFEMIDSSHGDDDVRQNYIIDKKYVLRLNSAKVMTDERLSELNMLIKKYNDFGLKAPYFMEKEDGTFLSSCEGNVCYLSEYLDLEIAGDVEETFREQLIEERIIFVSKFAEKYRNKDLSETMSMYSLFELAPYDEAVGVDEKQDNFNVLVDDLKQSGAAALAEALAIQYQKIRGELVSFYKTLPKCFFQGDENFSNLCVNEERHIIGLFDFNMSGTDVIANYLANIAFQGNFYYTEEILAEHSAEDVLESVLFSYRKSTEMISKYYHFTEEERRAYQLYSKIVMISGYVNQTAFSSFLKNQKLKDKGIKLIQLILKQMEEEICY